MVRCAIGYHLCDLGGGRPWGGAAVGGVVGWGLWNLQLLFLATPMGGRCCWWGCGLGALESAIASFSHSHGGALLLVGLWAGAKCFVIFLSVKLFCNL